MYIENKAVPIGRVKNVSMPELALPDIHAIHAGKQASKAIFPDQVSAA